MEFGDYRAGWPAGVQAAASWNKFAVPPALLFAQKGYSYTTDITYRNAYNLPAGNATIRYRLQLSYLAPPSTQSMPLPAKTAPSSLSAPT